MEIAATCEHVSSLTGNWARTGEKIALVPTMGYLHQGHLSLVRMAHARADRVVVSIFVNPIQFGPQEDLSAYPRDFNRDKSLLQKEDVDALFFPEVDEVYPHGFQTTVRVGLISKGLCGRNRPGHFDGVCTVVSKLLNIVKPDYVVFGEKDFQQLAVVRRMVDDLNIAVEVLGHPIVREEDGLAMSSRNVYLNTEERRSALCLNQAIKLAGKLAAEGELRVEKLHDTLDKFIISHKGTGIDYISFVDKLDLQPVVTVDQNTLLALAVKINNRVRLIDNGLVLHQSR